MKRILVLLVAVTMLLGLAACGGTQSAEKPADTTAAAVETTAAAVETTAAAGEAPAGKSSKPEKDWKIAIVPKDSTNAWFVRMEVGVKEYAKDSGLNVFQKGPAKTDAAMQAQVIQDLIAQGVDALGVIPVDPAALEPVLEEAMSKGIVVVTHEGSTQQNTMYDIEAFNNAGFGAFIMDNLAAVMGEEGVYTTMVGHVTNASHNEWADGAIARQKEKYPNMKLLEAEPRVESEDNQERAYEKAKELFKKYPDLKGIVGTSSKDAIGVAKAIEEMGLQGKKFTAGTAMPNESMQFLKSGTLSSGALWDPKDAGYALAELAVKILRGEKIENGLNLKKKGYESMKFAEGSDKVLLGAGWVVITKENVDSFGF